MLSDIVLQLALFVAALVANLLSALAGGGAGLVQLPVLILLGLPFPLALATHKVASVALGVGATLRHAQEKALDWRFALFILACGLPGVVLGARVVLAVPASICTLLLGLLTIGLGLYSMMNPALGNLSQPAHRNHTGLVIGGGVLFAIGFLNGSLTSGTGLFVTLVRTGLQPCRSVHTHSGRVILERGWRNNTWHTRTDCLAVAACITGRLRCWRVSRCTSCHRQRQPRHQALL